MAAALFVHVGPRWRHDDCGDPDIMEVEGGGGEGGGGQVRPDTAPDMSGYWWVAAPCHGARARCG